MSLKTIATTLLRALPDDGRSVRKLYRRAVDARRHREIRRLQRAGGWKLPSPDSVLWIDPGRIRLLTNLHVNGVPIYPLGRIFPLDWHQPVYPGEWDVGGIVFDDIEACVAIRARVQTGAAWQDTGYWKESLRSIEDGNVRWDCRNADELAGRFAYVDGLIDSIRRFGIVPHSAVGSEHDPAGRFTEDIEVNISRDGEFLFQDGRHRLAIAKVLGLARIPVKVKVRHETWQRFRESLFAMAEQRGARGRLRQRPAHPDLADIPVDPWPETAVDLLLPRVRPGARRLVDLGADLGYCCERFERAGLDCTGVEADAAVALAANTIAQTQRSRYRVSTGPVLDAQVQAGLVQAPVDVVLAFDVLHRLMRPGAETGRLAALLAALAPAQMFISTPTRGGDDGQSVDASTLVAFAQQHAALPHAELVHESDDGRRLYVLQR